MTSLEEGRHALDELIGRCIRDQTGHGTILEEIDAYVKAAVEVALEAAVERAASRACSGLDGLCGHETCRGAREAVARIVR